ncbi:hypothetical protein EON65_36980 [archaeon]|nr:MAG: hypothetical protein EON65_36980 [archaeon]
MENTASSHICANPLPSNVLHVNEVQRGNPLLQYVRNVKINYTRDITPDYAMTTTCALFISVKYHHRHPKHISRRIDEVGKNYRLRVLLVLVDDESNLTAINELNHIAFNSNFTLILAFSNTECARYLETFKSYENKSAVSIQEREETEFLPRLNQVLCNVKAVNKTDVLTLLDTFSDFSNICNATEEQLILCPGIGEKKVKRLYQALHVPFQRQDKHTSKPDTLAENNGNKADDEVEEDARDQQKNANSSGAEV